jgi:chorismate mutase
VRGATTCGGNAEDAILRAAGALLRRVFRENRIRAEDVAAVLFTATPDLDAAFPARAARELGLEGVPLLCAREIPVPGDVPRCLRVLVLWNTEKSPGEIRHVYLRGARLLREYGRKKGAR